jgi:hypothetical protein
MSATLKKEHHQFTDRDQNYVSFEVKCESCGMLMFEFAHRQRVLTSQDRIMAIPDHNPAIGAQSWYKPAVRVICRNGNHEILPVFPGEDRNQVVKSAPMNDEQFKAWMEEL